jgi:FMN phosphatase YigB (HAD superfamily)
LIRRVDVPAETIAFTDELLENLSPAARLGIRTVLLAGPDDL